jgi:hypothetical protein
MGTKPSSRLRFGQFPMGGLSMGRVRALAARRPERAHG